MSKAWRLTEQDIYTVLSRHNVGNPDRVTEAEGLVADEAGRIEKAARSYAGLAVQRRVALSAIEDLLIQEGTIAGPKLFTIDPSTPKPGGRCRQGGKKVWSYAEAQRTVPYVRQCLR